MKKFPEPLLRSPRSPRSNDLETQNDEYSKRQLAKTKWNPKFSLSDLINDLLTSMTSKRGSVNVLEFLKLAEKNGVFRPFLQRSLGSVAEVPAKAADKLLMRGGTKTINWVLMKPIHSKNEYKKPRLCTFSFVGLDSTVQWSRNCISLYM